MATLYRLLTYAARNHLSGTSYLVFACIMLVMGFVLTFRLEQGRFRTASWMIAGVWAGHMLIVGIDWLSDPTTHNLFPFEFIILGVVALPVYAGAALGRAIGRQSPAGGGSLR